MYKHECVVCLREHGYKCLMGISFFDRFLGTNKVINCFEYNNILKYQKRYNSKDKRGIVKR